MGGILTENVFERVRTRPENALRPVGSLDPSDPRYYNRVIEWARPVPR